MDPKEAYARWSRDYDSNLNRTRDLEAFAIRETLGALSFDTCLELGCGTGKNTVWLLGRTKHIKAVDLSEEMLDVARGKIRSDKVEFCMADIQDEWEFADRTYDLISVSLVLEHIEHLDGIFDKMARTLVSGGHLYIGELHPFKQYSGTQARFETEEGRQTVQCFLHHISDFTQLAKKNFLDVIEINEYFDENDRSGIPRICTLLFRKA